MAGKSATRISDLTSGICDVGDKCCPHGRHGQNEMGSPNVTINNKKAHRQGDKGDCNCPHGGTYRSVSGSKTVTVNGKPLTRINDITNCQGCGLEGRHTHGSPNVTAGD